MTVNEEVITDASARDAEADISFFAASENCTIARDTAQAHSGAASVRQRSSAAGNMALSHNPNKWAVIAGMAYRASAWVLGSVARDTALFQQWYDTGGSFISSTSGNGADVTTGWTKSEVQCTAPATAASVNHYNYILGTAAANEDHWWDDFSVLPDDPYIQPRGSLANVTSGGTSVVSLPLGSHISVDNYLVMVIAVDNSGSNGALPGDTVTDSAGNTWTQIGTALNDPGAANAGVALYAYYTKVVNTYADGGTITNTWGTGSPAAKGILVFEIENLNLSSVIAVASTSTTGNSTTPSVSRTPTAAGQLMMGCVATQGPVADTYTADSDTTGGSWSGVNRIGGANATAASNVTIAVQFKWVTDLSAQTFNPTLGTSRVWAALGVVLASRPSPPPIPHNRRADMRHLLTR